VSATYLVRQLSNVVRVSISAAMLPSTRYLCPLIISMI